jgi:hypothetical protein
MSKPMTKQEIRVSIRNCRRYLREIEYQLKQDDWDKVSIWVGTIEGEFGGILERLENWQSED